LGHAALDQGGNQFRELAHPQPDDFVHQRREGRIGLALERHRDKPLPPLRAHLACKGQGQ